MVDHFHFYKSIFERFFSPLIRGPIILIKITDATLCTQIFWVFFQIFKNGTSFSFLQKYFWTIFFTPNKWSGSSEDVTLSYHTQFLRIFSEFYVNTLTPFWNYFLPLERCFKNILLSTFIHFKNVFAYLITWIEYWSDQTYQT